MIDSEIWSKCLYIGIKKIGCLIKNVYDKYDNDKCIVIIMYSSNIIQLCIIYCIIKVIICIDVTYIT